MLVELFLTQMLSCQFKLLRQVTNINFVVEILYFKSEKLLETLQWNHLPAFFPLEFEQLFSWQSCISFWCTTVQEFLQIIYEDSNEHVFSSNLFVHVASGLMTPKSNLTFTFDHIPVMSLFFIFSVLKEIVTLQYYNAMVSHLVPRVRIIM